ncbi:gluconate 2-dehydrogenase subunit 3 family protein [Azomonas macrocytogenes]|uniref:Uncharacterized protein n=1 Tax=Azomonas macrocytogenes TaxID=69962 RepID=A0A839SYU5_AZOMA|nr:gluconate 2-dehydrogenase subunit 3 family protein [Azomonas macrocytogenes]MBB3102312.1 hypothetical protein [Azomonas macrocytogenes]
MKTIDPMHSPSLLDAFRISNRPPLATLGPQPGPCVVQRPSAKAYRPDFFSGPEWAFLNAACACLIPAGVTSGNVTHMSAAQFIDRHMHTPYAHGKTHSQQDLPGKREHLSVRDLLRTGMKAMDRHCQHTFDNRRFVELEPALQENLLQAAGNGTLALDDGSAAAWFAQLQAEVRLACLCLPEHDCELGTRQHGPSLTVSIGTVRSSLSQ